ncbi:HamA C-terminal domain-containing protein [Lonepinella sp. BR2271]|uniref:HamA C-terminal domain-containing protein n=1 Tax=Lonepinella sp. BR2271 TaxID=3434550 RepID=UPI003F6DF344
MSFPEPPEPFLEVRVHDFTNNPLVPVCALCVGYEGGEWRASSFASHVMEWLPEFCLPIDKLNNFSSSNGLRLIREAARLVYQTDKYQTRGEFGELFLHMVLRQIYKSIPVISKIYFKDSANNTVKGYDAVHAIEINEKLELWLGEVKFYKDKNKAIKDVIDEIKDHIKIDYMKNEKMFILNKMDKSIPYYDKLSKLLNTNTSLDKLFDCVCIPILITYESSVLTKYDKSTDDFKKDCVNEVMDIRKDLESKLRDLNLPVKIYLFLIPLQNKSILLSRLNDELKRLQ